MRQANMMQRGGVWYVRARVKGKDVWRSTKQRDERAAVRVGRRILADLETAEARPEVPTLSEWWETYQRTYAKQHAASTQRNEPGQVAPALEALGAYRLDEIPRSLCVEWLNKRGERVSPSTIRTEHTKLQAIFQRAVEEGLVEANPWRGIKKPPMAIRERVLTFDEQERLLLDLNEEEGRWLLFMLGTGLRIGELAGMVLDIDRHLIHVVGKGSKPRSVPMLDRVPELVALGIPSRTARQWRDLLRRESRAAGIGSLHPHALRHTFATRYLQAGGDVYTLSKILGHASVTITEKIYAHLLSEDLLARSRGISLGLVANSVAAPKILAFPR